MEQKNNKVNITNKIKENWKLIIVLIVVAFYLLEKLLFS